MGREETVKPDQGNQSKGGHIPKALPAPAQNWEPTATLPVPTGMRANGIDGWDQKILVKPWLMMNQSQPW